MAGGGGIEWRKATIVAAIGVPVAVLVGLATGLAVEPRRTVEHRPAEPRLASAMAPVLAASVAVELESVHQHLRLITGDAPSLEDLQAAALDTDDAIAEVETSRPSGDALGDLADVTTALREDLTQARAEADAAAGTSDLTAPSDVELTYVRATARFEDGVTAALAGIEDPDMAAAASLTWHARCRARAAAALRTSLIGVGPDMSPFPGLPSDLDPAFPPVSDAPADLTPMPDDPTGTIDPYDPQLPPRPEIPELPPGILDPPPTLPPEVTDPPPPVTLTAARRAGPGGPPAGSFVRSPAQEPPELTVSRAPTQAANLAARVRAAEAALAGAPAPYAAVVGAIADENASLLQVADELIAGRPVPWSDVMDQGLAATPSGATLAYDIVDRYDETVRSTPGPAVRVDHGRRFVVGGLVGAFTLAGVVGLASIIAAATSAPAPPMTVPGYGRALPPPPPSSWPPADAPTPTDVSAPTAGPEPPDPHARWRPPA